jgi:hypothetical protein
LPKAVDALETVAGPVGALATGSEQSGSLSARAAELN